ncbi:unnamed protein product [Brassica oleracea]
MENELKTVTEKMDKAYSIICDRKQRTRDFTKASLRRSDAVVVSIDVNTSSVHNRYQCVHNSEVSVQHPFVYISTTYLHLV